MKVKSFTIAWEALQFFDKFKVLIWIKDLIEAWDPAESETLKAKETLETGISEIIGYLSKISDISDMLLSEILPTQGDCCEIKDSETDEDIISFHPDDFDHPELMVRVCRSREGDNFFVQTTAHNLNWADLPPLEKSFLLRLIKGNCHNKQGILDLTK